MLAMLAAVAEMERDLIVERTQAGLARAKAEGKTLGRPAKTTPEQREYATETVREELKDRMAAAEASELSTYSLAQAVGCQGIYDSLYRVHSAATHSTPRSLVGYVTEIDSGVVTELHRKPQMGTIPQCLFTLVDLLLNTKTFFDRLMELEKNSEVARLRRAVDAITKFD